MQELKKSKNLISKGIDYNFIRVKAQVSGLKCYNNYSGLLLVVHLLR